MEVIDTLMIKLDFKEYLNMIEQGNSSNSIFGQAGRHPHRAAKPAKSFPAPKNPFPKLVQSVKVDRQAPFLHPDTLRLDLDPTEFQFDQPRFDITPLKAPPAPLTTKRQKKLPK